MQLTEREKVILNNLEIYDSELNDRYLTLEFVDKNENYLQIIKWEKEDVINAAFISPLDKCTKDEQNAIEEYSQNGSFLHVLLFRKISFQSI